jgi:hypothetical protein
VLAQQGVAVTHTHTHTHTEQVSEAGLARRSRQGGKSWQAPQLRRSNRKGLRPLVGVETEFE